MCVCVCVREREREREREGFLDVSSCESQQLLTVAFPFIDLVFPPSFGFFLFDPAKLEFQSYRTPPLFHSSLRRAQRIVGSRHCSNNWLRSGTCMYIYICVWSELIKKERVGKRGERKGGLGSMFCLPPLFVLILFTHTYYSSLLVVFSLTHIHYILSRSQIFTFN